MPAPFARKPDHPGRGLVLGSHSLKVRKHPTSGRVAGTGLRELPPAPGGEVAGQRWYGMVLDAAPLAPRAAEAFTPEELEERLAYYAARAAAKLPLFS